MLRPERETGTPTGSRRSVVELASALAIRGRRVLPFFFTRGIAVFRLMLSRMVSARRDVDAATRGRGGGSGP